MSYLELSKLLSRYTQYIRHSPEQFREIIRYYDDKGRCIVEGTPSILREPYKNLVPAVMEYCTSRDLFDGVLKVCL